VITSRKILERLVPLAGLDKLSPIAISQELSPDATRTPASDPSIRARPKVGVQLGPRDLTPEASAEAKLALRSA
jgi:hypothetical protein